MQAINNYVIVTESNKEETTASGIIMGSTATDIVTATVVSVGQDAKYLTGGEEVMFLRVNGKAITCDGESYLSVPSEGIILKT